MNTGTYSQKVLVCVMLICCLRCLLLDEYRHLLAHSMCKEYRHLLTHSMCYVHFLRCLAVWKRRAGITKKFTTHYGRHSYGHLLARAGFDTYRIQQALGQETMTAALTYTHLVKEELKSELDRNLPSFNIKGARNEAR